VAAVEKTAVGENVEFSVEKDTLVIRVKLKARGRPSKKTGKTIVIASTCGNPQIAGTDLKFNLNVYRKKKDEE
jgi:hypothetical protein